MKIRIAYGRTGMEIDVPDAYQPVVLRAADDKPLADPRAELRRALRSPTDAPALRDVAARAVARADRRQDADGLPVLLPDQDRSRWNNAMITEALSPPGSTGRPERTFLVAMGMWRGPGPALATLDAHERVHGVALADYPWLMSLAHTSANRPAAARPHASLSKKHGHSAATG